MILLGDEAQLEARFGLFGDSANLDARSVHGLRQTYHSLRNHLGRTPIELLGDVGQVESRSVYLEMVFVLVQERCMVCTYHRLRYPFGRIRWNSKVTWVMWNLVRSVWDVVSVSAR